MAGKEPSKIAAAPRKQFSKKRLILFKTISVLVAILVLFVLEIALRLFHYGYNPDLFISYPSDKNYLIFNPEASKKYFTDRGMATTGNVEPFKKEKDTNTLRIFVLGESTTIGYPYFHNGSFHRWLQYRLMQSMPDKNLEIINCSLTAVNSYTVLGFAKEIVHYQPDAVLIYTGHNEYYGAMGVGSTNKLWGNPGMVNLVIRLRELKLGQLISNCFQRVAGLFNSKKTNSGKRRMELMVAEQQIQFGSDLFTRGIRQFESNMDAVLKLFNKNHIPVFISNLVSNEKDLKPFINLPVDSVQFPSFRPNYELGLKAYEKGNFLEAEKYFLLANQAFPTHASCNFYLGRIAYQNENLVQAKSYFSKALDLDALRFRAPHQMNETIINLCNKYRNTHFVDAKALFEAWSKNNIIGDELILEHVHPNLLGYALLSDAFYQTMKQTNIFSIQGDKEISFGQLLQTMPVTSMDSLAASYKISSLKKSWPFSQALLDTGQLTDSIITDSEEKKLAYDLAFNHMSWEDATNNLYNYYIANHDLKKAGIVIQALVLEHPTEITYYEKAANIYGELNDYSNAVFYFKKAFGISPSPNTARYIFVLYFKLDKPAEAMTYLDYGIRNGGGAAMVSIKKLAEEIILLQEKYSENPGDVTILNQIAVKYLQMSNKETALHYLDKVLQTDNKNKEALTLLVQLKNGEH